MFLAIVGQDAGCAAQVDEGVVFPDRGVHHCHYQTSHHT